MKTNLKLLDVVALLKEIPEKNLSLGQVGTIVEKLENDAFEVEFCDKNGITLATIALESQYLLQLHYEMETA